MVLAMVLLVCFIVVIVVALTYFYGSSDNEYGDRLEGIKDVKITEKVIDKVTSSIEESEIVKSSSIDTKGKLIYLSIKFVDGTTLDTAKPVAEGAMSYFSKEELEFYDINITISASGEAEFTLMGAKNSGGSGIVVWNNNRIVEEESDTD